MIIISVSVLAQGHNIYKRRWWMENVIRLVVYLGTCSCLAIFNKHCNIALLVILFTCTVMRKINESWTHVIVFCLFLYSLHCSLNLKERNINWTIKLNKCLIIPSNVVEIRLGLLNIILWWLLSLNLSIGLKKLILKVFLK